MSDIRIPWSDWEIKRKIGSGSFGSVYEIERKDLFGLTEQSALKVIMIPKEDEDLYSLRAEGYTEEGMTTYYKTYLKSVMSEYALMAELNGHPNIVSCLDRKAERQENGIGWNIYIRMELLTSFNRKIHGKEIGEEETIKISKDLCKALIACHERNIIHRDIKPENIFVTKYGDYKLGDFGVAKVMSHTANATRTGTPYYMAPEVCKDEPYGKEADIYSLGLVMYWLMNKRRLPFIPTDQQPSGIEKEKAYKRRVMGEEIPEPAEGSKELKRIILKETAYDPRDRYHSAEELLSDLESLQKEAAKPEEAVIVEEPYEEETNQTLDIYHAPRLRKDAEKEQIQEDEPVTEQNPESEEITEEEDSYRTLDVYQAKRLRRKGEEEQTKEEEQHSPEEEPEPIEEKTDESDNSTERFDDTVKTDEIQSGQKDSDNEHSDDKDNIKSAGKETDNSNVFSNQPSSNKVKPLSSQDKKESSSKEYVFYILLFVIILICVYCVLAE